MPQEDSFGLWLRERRTALDLTQWELAERIGCSRETIQKLEAGSRRPSKQVAELLAAYLRIALEERAAFVTWARLGSDSASPGVAAWSPSAPPPAEQAAIDGIPRTHLPTPLTSLIGRARQVEAVRSYVLRKDVRLLTLVGPPGIGKTRLSIEAASCSAGAFPDGVYFVPLEAVNDPSQVAAAIAAPLGAKQVGKEPAVAALARHLRDKHLLLVLDNFEQVLDAGPQVEELLSTCPDLKTLVTSREALHVYGEWRFPVPRLELPPGDRRPDLRTVAEVASVALFTQRAQAVKADWALTRDNVETVAAICTRLDGLPLAIELAAARIGRLSPAQILAGLGSQLKLLKADLRHLPPRQRTLRGAIDWSYHLLQPSECILFRRLGVFAEGCTLAAAEAVCGGQGPVSTAASVAEDLDVSEELASLLDKSLLQFKIAEEAGADDEGRYAMLEVLREYALDQLRASGEEQLIRRRHAEYYVTVAEAITPQLYGPEQAKWVRRLEAEYANIRAALAWSVQGQGETAAIALRLSGTLARFWDMRGRAGEGRRWIELALENAGSGGENTATGESAPATIPIEVRIKAISNAGALSRVQGDYPAARFFHEQALRLSQERGYKKGIATSLLNLGNMATHLADYAEAQALYEQVLALDREMGDKAGAARTMVNMGFAARYMGDSALARSLYEEVLAVRRELGDQYGIALTLGNLGELAAEQGDFAKAHEQLEASLAIRREIGDERGVAYCLIELAGVARAEHDEAKARDLFREGLVLRQRVGDTEGIGACLESLAAFYVGIGQRDRGIRLWGAAEAIRKSVGVPIPLAFRSRYEAAVAQVRAEAGETAFMALWAEGQAMTVEQAIADVLSDAG